MNTAKPGLNRWWLAALAASCLFAAFMISTTTAAPARAAVGGKRAAILFPFAGGGKTWISGDGPAVHHTFYYGWAEDLHAPVNTAVQARFQSSDGPITLQVVDVQTLNCSPSAGKVVFVEVKVGGTAVGRVLFEHLENVQVSAGQSISVGATLGYLKLWGQSTCWQDTLSDGVVHTHLEAQRACYRSLPAWTSVGGSTVVGMLSSAYGTSNKSVCDEAEVSQVLTATPPLPPAVNLSGAVYDGRDQLAIGQTLQANHYLMSADGRDVLYMGTDGNLVVYGPNLVALWSSGTVGSGGAYIAMQSDGNLVMYRSNGVTAVWASGSSGRGGTYTVLQQDGNFVMYQANHATAVWSSHATAGAFTATSFGSDHLSVGQTLQSNKYLVSADGRYRLLKVGDGNIVLYGPGYHVLWSVGQGSNGAYIAMQSDGNLVEYLANGVNVVWASNTAGSGGSYVTVQNDGNVVMYRSDGATVVWETYTGGRI